MFDSYIPIGVILIHIPTSFIFIPTYIPIYIILEYTVLVLFPFNWCWLNNYIIYIYT